jgi:FkbM family methyltransferase
VKLHRRLAGLFGYELVKKRKLHDTLEQHLEALLPQLRVNCVVDVGANQGQFGALLRRIGYAGRIVSFEPLGAAFAELQKRRELDGNWDAHRIALGRAAESATLRQYESADFSSFRQPNAFGQQRFGWRVALAGEEQVEVRPLADCWGAISDGIAEPRVFLKLDTQGYDLEVLAGAATVLEHVVALQSEVSLKPIYEGMPGHLEALTEFERLGFEITGLYPVTRDKLSLAIIEIDCVLRRRGSARR